MALKKRKEMIVGNWKMNTTRQEASHLTTEILSLLNTNNQNNVDVVLCPPFLHLDSIIQLTQHIPHLKVGAQNCSAYAKGAYTGEISANMLQSIGATHVIIGHSECRQFFNESSALLVHKLTQALAHSLTPIYCCGESLEVRKNNQHETFVSKQIEEVLFNLDNKAIQKIVIAYEPIWAIGTGQTASPNEAQYMHAAIRKHLAECYGENIANNISLLYGGSVKPNNAKEIFANADIDGGLIGGAALQGKEFVDIIDCIKKK